MIYLVQKRKLLDMPIIFLILFYKCTDFTYEHKRIVSGQLLLFYDKILRLVYKETNPNQLYDQRFIYVKNSNGRIFIGWKLEVIIKILGDKKKEKRKEKESGWKQTKTETQIK